MIATISHISAGFLVPITGPGELATGWLVLIFGLLGWKKSVI